MRPMPTTPTRRIPDVEALCSEAANPDEGEGGTLAGAAIASEFIRILRNCMSDAGARVTTITANESNYIRLPFAAVWVAGGEASYLERTRTEHL